MHNRAEDRLSRYPSLRGWRVWLEFPFRVERGAVASGFTTIPRHVLELDRRVELLELPEVPWKLVAPYLLKSDAGRIAYIERAERKIAEAEFVKGQTDWYRVLQTLGLPP